MRKFSLIICSVTVFMFSMFACPISSSATVRFSDLNTQIPAGYSINENMQGKAKDGRYNSFFPKDSIQEIRINIGETNLQYLMENALDKPYVMTDSVQIGDEVIGYCGLKTKGAYTLNVSVTDRSHSPRLSFTISFGEYVNKENFGEKQNFYGCKKISLNNFFFDKCMLKEYCSLTLLSEMGVVCPQFALAKLYINDQYYGVYFMIEAMEDTILQQHLQVSGKEISDYLVKPEATSLLYEDILENDSPLYENDRGKLAKMGEMYDVALDWTRKINLLSDGFDFDGKEIDVNSDEYLTLLENVLDVDAVVKYFAVHSFLVQTDDMFTEYHNYGLYIDKNGRALIVPWDYDLAFGTYFPGYADAVANYDIDVMYKSNAAGEGKEKESYIAYAYKKFPLFYVIYQNDKLMEKYHFYMEEAAKVAVLGGEIYSGQFVKPGNISAKLDALYNPLLDAASEKLSDGIKYFNASQPKNFKAGFSHMKKIMAMRALAVHNQINGVEARVSTKGCDTSFLGNGMPGGSANDGSVMAIDCNTGIYTTADYEAKSQWSDGPTLRVAIDEDNEYKKAYTLHATARPVNDEMFITIPLDEKFMEKNRKALVYAVSDSGKDKLEIVSFSGNLLTVKAAYNIEKLELESVERSPLPIIIAITCLSLIVLIVFIVITRSRKKGKN